MTGPSERTGDRARPLFAAVDLGATSGRVIVGRAGPGELDLTEVHRFPNTPVRRPTGLHWDLPALYGNILDGLRKAGGHGPIASIGIDTWGVDYGLLDADGELLGNPYHYRDARTERGAARVAELFAPGELYAITGLQEMPINTVNQLAAARGSAELAAARTVLMIPDLLTHRLTGTLGAEATNASTTGLFDAAAGEWSDTVIDRLGLDRGLFPPLRHPGEPAGGLLPEAAAATGLPAGTPVVAVGSHDTASAVAAVPATGPGFGYVSCGTWSLAGLELPGPVLGAASREANFTNERGIDGSIRYLRNTMGLWLLEEARRAWGAAAPSLRRLLDEAGNAEPFAALIDADDPEFLRPDAMPERIAAALRRTGQPVPDTPGGLVRTILESLALAHRRTLRRAAELSGQPLTRIHLVGGGSRNALLCQWTADATGLPVTAGPAEATALGNILVQARAAGRIGGGLPEMRRLIAETQPVRRYRPDPASADAWEAAARG